MKYLVFFTLIVGCITTSKPDSNYSQAVDQTLRSQWKRGRRLHNVVREEGSLEVRYQFWADDKTLYKIQTSQGPNSRDSIVNYRFHDDKLVLINFGFKTIYSLYYFKEGQLMDHVVRKRNWEVADINMYLQKGLLYLSEAKKIQDAISH